MGYLSSNPAAAAAKRSPLMANLTEERMRSMDLNTSNSLFVATVQEVSRLLGLASGAVLDIAEALPLNADAQYSQPCSQAQAATDLHHLVKGLTETAYVMSLLHPSYARLKYEGSLAGEPSEPPPEHWQQVVTAGAFEEEQLQDMAVLFDIHRSLSAKVHSQRRQLVSQLQQLLGNYSNNIMDVAARQDIQTLTDKLHRSVQQERCVLFLATEVFDSMLTIEQAARLLIASYPFKPNDMAIIGSALDMWQKQRPCVVNVSSGQPARPVVTTT